MRANARNWLELADKVWHYRRDQLNDADARELRARIESLRQQVAARAEAAKLKLGIEALEPVLQRLGGKVYPKTSLVENVEFFLIAAIVIIGIRTYFVQPFKIPTNSMWPSYYGMTPEVYKNPADHPSPVLQALRFVAFGARNHTLTAPAGGPIEAEFFYEDVRLAYEKKSGHTWLVIPTDVKEYTFLRRRIARDGAGADGFRFRLGRALRLVRRFGGDADRPYPADVQSRQRGSGGEGV